MYYDLYIKDVTDTNYLADTDTKNGRYFDRYRYFLHFCGGILLEFKI